jgi:hypothetical protein
MELWRDIFNENGGTRLATVGFDGLGKPMSNVTQYRRSAASLLDLAQRTNSPADKNRLLVMAETWLDLAGRATKLTGTRAPDQPPLGHGDARGANSRTTTLTRQGHRALTIWKMKIK